MQSEHRGATLHRRGREFGVARRGADDEFVSDRLLGQRVPLQDLRRAAVADDGDGVTVRDQFSQAVGHEDDDAPGRGQAVHAPEKVVRFLFRQRRVGFIEQKDTGIPGEGPGDLRSLLDGKAD